MENTEAKAAFDESFDINWVANLIDSNISDSTPPVDMATFKRFLKISAEDGNYFRSVTTLNNLVMKLNAIERHIEDGFDAIEAKL